MHAVTRCGPLLGLLLLLLASSGARAVTAEVGRHAPNFALPSIWPEQPPVDLADYRGKVVYLDFWSSWCAPCRRVMPHLNALRDEFSRNDFEVIAINVDPLVADGRRFLEKVPVNYPVVVDAAGEALARYGVAVLPASFVIDRRGVVRAVMRGQAVEDVRSLRTKLQRLIGGDGIR